MHTPPEHERPVLLSFRHSEEFPKRLVAPLYEKTEHDLVREKVLTNAADMVVAPLLLPRPVLDALVELPELTCAGLVRLLGCILESEQSQNLLQLSISSRLRLDPIELARRRGRPAALELARGRAPALPGHDGAVL